MEVQAGSAVKGEIIPRQYVRPLYFLANLAILGGMGWLDWVIGNRFSIAPLAFVVVVGTILLSGRKAGYCMAVMAAVLFLWIDFAQARNAEMSISIWNAGIRFFAYVLVSLLVVSLRDARRKAEELARTDMLTGLTNRRYFNELLDLHSELMKRHPRPLSLAYMDLDHFKEVNDTYGHPTGNKLLRLVGECMRSAVRKTDIPVRLGGDEFAIILPETESEDAQRVVQRVVEHIQEAMRKNHWPVTASIGLATFLTAPEQSVELLKKADELMYAAKEKGRNTVCHAVIEENSVA